MCDFKQLQQKIAALLESIPADINVEWRLLDNSVDWNIIQKPVGFDLEDEEKLMSKLNSINDETTMRQFKQKSVMAKETLPHDEGNKAFNDKVLPDNNPYTKDD